MHGTIKSGLSVEIRRLDELSGVTAGLRALAASAAVPNVFYEPAFVTAARPTFGHDVLVGLVWRHTASVPELVAMFPVRIVSRRYVLKLPILMGWTHPYAPLGTPLVHRDHVAAAIAAWIDHIAADPRLPKILLMPYLPADDAIAAAFDVALVERDGLSRQFDPHRRALLAPTADLAADRSTYLEQALGPKKRKELRRQRKRLAETGVLTSSIISEPAGVTAALAEFLSLEAAGWKGRANTAAQQHDDIRRFVESAVSRLAAEGKASVARLALDSRAIAVIVTLRSGDTAWCWKIAYDESLARASPGVQLLLDATQNLLGNIGIARADSCATADHPMIDHIWRERLTLSDRIVCVSARDAALFARVSRLEVLRRNAIGTIKRLRRMVQPA